MLKCRQTGPQCPSLVGSELHKFILLTETRALRMQDSLAVVAGPQHCLWRPPRGSSGPQALSPGAGRAQGCQQSAPRPFQQMSVYSRARLVRGVEAAAPSCEGLQDRLVSLSLSPLCCTITPPCPFLLGHLWVHMGVGFQQRSG